jgi:hypothetical protein
MYLDNKMLNKRQGRLLIVGKDESVARLEPLSSAGR